MYFRFNAHVFDRKTHRRANVMQRIDRWYREVTAFDGWPMTRVAVFDAAVGIPRTFIRVDFVERALHRVVPGDVVEYKELVFGAEECSIRDAGRLEVSLGTIGK